MEVLRCDHSAQTQLNAIDQSGSVESNPKSDDSESDAVITLTIFPDRNSKIIGQFLSSGVLNIFRISMLQLIRIESGAVITPKTATDQSLPSKVSISK